MGICVCIWEYIGRIWLFGLWDERLGSYGSLQAGIRFGYMGFTVPSIMDSPTIPLYITPLRFPHLP